MDPSDRPPSYQVAGNSIVVVGELLSRPEGQFIDVIQKQLLGNVVAGDRLFSPMIPGVRSRGSKKSWHRAIRNRTTGSTRVRHLLGDRIANEKTQSIREFLLRLKLNRIVIGPTDC